MPSLPGLEIWTFLKEKTTATVAYLLLPHPGGGVRWCRLWGIRSVAKQTCLLWVSGRPSHPLPGPRGQCHPTTVLSLLHWLWPSDVMASSVFGLHGRLPVDSRESYQCTCWTSLEISYWAVRISFSRLQPPSISYLHTPPPTRTLFSRCKYVAQDASRTVLH